MSPDDVDKSTFPSDEHKSADLCALRGRKRDRR